MSESASVTITQQTGYQFLIDFGATIPQLLADEPAPMGAGAGPTPSLMLLASVANCLSASLLFTLQKFKQSQSAFGWEMVAVRLNILNGYWNNWKASAPYRKVCNRASPSLSTSKMDWACG